MTKSFAGIGSREMPVSYGSAVSYICDILIRDGYTLRSGGADGTDKSFQYNYIAKGGNMEIYLPYNGFNGMYHDDESFLCMTPYHDESFEIASKYHPKWNNLSEGGKLMMARNTHQVLGKHLHQKSDFIVCYTKDGKVQGGTGQALRMAMSDEYDTPIFNMGLYKPNTHVITSQFLLFYQSLDFWRG